MPAATHFRFDRSQDGKPGARAELPGELRCVYAHDYTAGSCYLLDRCGAHTVERMAGPPVVTLYVKGAGLHSGPAHIYSESPAVTRGSLDEDRPLTRAEQADLADRICAAVTGTGGARGGERREALRAA